MYIHIYMYIHVCIHIYKYIHVYIYTYIYMCIYTHIPSCDTHYPAGRVCCSVLQCVAACRIVLQRCFAVCHFIHFVVSYALSHGLTL